MTNESANPRRRLQPDMIVAIAAVVVGVCALGVSLFQASIMQQQQAELSQQRRAEVWPYLQFGKGHANDVFRFGIANEGIGPARIRTISMTYDGEPVRVWFELLKAVHGSAQYSYIQSHIGGRVIRAGDAIEALIVEGELGDSLQAKVGGRLIAKMCYCSVYDDCWDYTENFASGAVREPVERCIPGEEEFEQ